MDAGNEHIDRYSKGMIAIGIGLPAIAAPVLGAPGLIAEIHENAGTVILCLAGIHPLIAGWHHIILRDGTLRRMSPL